MGTRDDVLIRRDRVLPERLEKSLNRIEELDGFQLLTMLKLDPETSDIPVLTYTTEYEGQEQDEEVAEPAETPIFAPKPAAWMN